MGKKIGAIFTVFCFLISSWSCVMKKDVTIMPEDIVTKKSMTGIFAVLKISGEEIEFHKSKLGRLAGDEIIGASGKKEKAIYSKASRADAFQFPLGKVLTSDDHREFVILRKLMEDKTNIVFEQIPQVHIPLADIEKIYLRKTNESGTFLTFGLVIGTFIVLAAVFGDIQIQF